MSKSTKAAKSKADELFRQIIASLGYCEARNWNSIPCDDWLQTAHIVTRERSATRTDTRNAFCLCFSHHRHFTDHTGDFERFIATTWANRYYDAVQAKSYYPTKVDWQERIRFLEEIKRGWIGLEEAREIEDA